MADLFTIVENLIKLGVAIQFHNEGIKIGGSVRSVGAEFGVTTNTTSQIKKEMNYTTV